MKRLRFLCSVAIAMLCIPPITYAKSIDLQTRSFDGGPINSSNVDNLQLKWTYLTAPDTGTNNTAIASISSTPAIKGKFIYFNDMAGNITKLNRFTGAVVWKKNYINDLSVPGYGIIQSRNTPYIVGNLVISGSNYSLLAPLCKVTGGTPVANGCHTGDGAIIIALDKNTGKVVWRIKADTHPAGKITGSISGYGNTIYVPVGSWEEDWARAYPNIFKKDKYGNIDPKSKYPCCSARGSLVAIDVTNPKILWKTYVVPGDGTFNDPLDNNPALSYKMQSLLTPRGFFGASTYGHNPTIDADRQQVYIATAQNTTAPKVAEACEKFRRGTGSYPSLPPGVTCTNLNDQLQNYASSVLALDMKTGIIKWVFHSRLYDAWNHACAAPDFYGWGTVPPTVYPVPLINAKNCFQDPVGPDMGFGNQPILVQGVKLSNGMTDDVVIAGNKDGRLFGLDPDTGEQRWVSNVDPGGIYGGLQFGRATDGKRVYFGTTNSSNVNRDINVPFRSAQTFLDYNGFSALGVRVGLYSQGDASPLVHYPAPTSQVMPFVGPNLVFGITDYPADYPTTFPDPNAGPRSPFLSVPASGPRELRTLINPPSDVTADGVTVFNVSGKLKTINGTVSAVDAGTGKILWQRPANDGIKGTLNPAQAFGTLTVGNGVVYIGYSDTRGTMVALDADTGVKLFQFQSTIPVNNVMTPAGGIESGPQVVGRRVYWGMGAETAADIPDKFGELLNGGNRLFMFMLPNCLDSFEDYLDFYTNYYD